MTRIRVRPAESQRPRVEYPSSEYADAIAVANNEEARLTSSSQVPLRAATRQGSGAPSLTLTEAELVEVTGYARPKDQARAIAKLGIPCLFRRDGSLSVARAHYENAFLGAAAKLDPPKVRLRNI